MVEIAGIKTRTRPVPWHTGIAAGHPDVEPSDAETMQRLTSADAMARVLCVGDIHGNVPATRRAVAAAVSNGCSAVLQVGDFWVSITLPGRPVSKHVRVARQSPVPWLWIDGNHEVWPTLSPDGGRTPQWRGRPVHMGGSLWWMTRGTVWEMAGTRFGAMGGAVSPDKWMPGLEYHRWDAEAPVTADFDELAANAAPEGLDVLISHDAPAGVTGLRSKPGSRIPVDLDLGIRQVRDKLTEVVKSLRPSLVVHGHWHHRYRSGIPAAGPDGPEVIGLAAADITPGPDSMLILDLSDPGNPEPVPLA